MVGWFGAIIRFFISAIVLLAVSFFVPGFKIVGFYNALLAAIVISIIGYIIERILGERDSPQSRGLVGFVTSAVVIWIIQFIIVQMEVTIIGALLAALVIGIIDAFVPTELR